MDNKILLNVIVPIIEENYNVFVPVGKPINNVREQLVKCINDLSLGAFDVEKTNLYDSNGELLNLESYVKDSGLKNGCKIYVI